MGIGVIAEAEMVTNEKTRPSINLGVFSCKIVLACTAIKTAAIPTILALIMVNILSKLWSANTLALIPKIKITIPNDKDPMKIVWLRSHHFCAMLIKAIPIPSPAINGRTKK